MRQIRFESAERQNEEDKSTLSKLAAGMHMLLSEDICTARWPDIPEQLFPGNSSCGNTEQMFLPKK